MANRGAEAAPDLILLDGKVFTADPARRNAEAVAIRGEKISAVGASAEILALAGPHTRRIDARGRVVIPGINDAHFHHTPEPPGVHLELKGMEPSWEEVLDALAAAVRTAPKGAWIFGSHGIQVVNDPRATRFALDRIAPDNPVVTLCYFGHGHVVNTRAMQVLRISPEEPDPIGGFHECVAGAKQITGKLFEYAGWSPCRRLFDGASDGDAAESARQLANEAVRFGITSIQNMSMLSADRYVGMLRAAQAPIRIRVIRFPFTQAGARAANDGRDLPLHPPGLPLATVRGTKWVLDGTPLERNAAQRTAYRDRPGWYGRLNFPEREMRAMLRESLESDDPLLVHAVGDKTVESFLDALEAEAKDVDWKPRRVRIEHGEGLFPDLLPRARGFGVVVVQNPSHFGFADTYLERYGEGCPHQPVRSLLEAGIPLALGSDGPLNPFLNLMFAVANPTRPSESLTREQAVEAYTRGSAFAEFEEDQKGTIASGKLADLAILSQDIFAAPVGDLPKTQSLLTMVGGRIVYDAGAVRVDK